MTSLTMQRARALVIRARQLQRKRWMNNEHETNYACTTTPRTMFPSLANSYHYILGTAQAAPFFSAEVLRQNEHKQNYIKRTTYSVRQCTTYSAQGRCTHTSTTTTTSSEKMVEERNAIRHAAVFPVFVVNLTTPNKRHVRQAYKEDTEIFSVGHITRGPGRQSNTEVPRLVIQCWHYIPWRTFCPSQQQPFPSRTLLHESPTCISALKSHQAAPPASHHTALSSSQDKFLRLATDNPPGDDSTHAYSASPIVRVKPYSHTAIGKQHRRNRRSTHVRDTANHDT